MNGGGQSHCRQRRVRLLLRFAVGDAIEFERQCGIVEDSQIRQQQEGLEYETDIAAAHAGSGIVIKPSNFPVVQRDGAGIGQIQAGNQIQQGRFAAAGIADNGDIVARQEFEADILQDGALSRTRIGFMKMRQAQHGRRIMKHDTARAAAESWQ